jgi:hypothetical protein
MGQLLPGYKKAIIDEIKASIDSNSSQYYAFAGNPIAHEGYPDNSEPNSYTNLYESSFINNWQMIFGKKIGYNDIMPVIDNNIWDANTVYNRYDNTVANLTNYYVITPPATGSSARHIYKCIDKPSEDAPSTQIPDQFNNQYASFTKSDGYTWRYISTVSSAQHIKFATDTHIPVTTNVSISTAAYNHSGVEVVMIANGGSGYSSYIEGTVIGITNSTVVQITANNINTAENFYTKNSIYFYNPEAPTSQLRTVAEYNVNSISGAKSIRLDKPINTADIAIPSIIKISPKVIFDTDGNTEPSARTEVDSTSNSISKIIILEPGYGISWANVTIQSNTTYGSGANVYAIVPPPGGHGSNPEVELNVKGFSVSFFFSNTEYGTIPGNTSYNKIGLIKNPYGVNQRVFPNLYGGSKSITPYSANTFSSVLEAQLIPPTAFVRGDTVIGANSSSRGTVAFCNSSHIYLTGDKYFIQYEPIVSSNGTLVANININTVGDIYTKDLNPLYVQNVTDVVRQDQQAESFKLIIKV